MSHGSGFPIVAVGASAGGVEALSLFFRTVPTDSGMAYVVVTHLGPGRQSLLYEILAQVAAIPVQQAVDGVELRPDTVYVLGSAAVMTFSKGRLQIHDVTSRQQNPIDVFFASLAEEKGELAIGVVLSGGGSDGTLGLKAIKEHGGLTVAQGSDSTAPQYPSMPESAIAAGTVDLVLAVQDIPARLVNYARTLPTPEQAAAGQPAPAERELQELRVPICEVLKGQVGHDFSGYKQATFLRRVRRRMQVLQIDAPQEYLEHLRQSPDEVGRLFRDLLIGVTSFFRDADAFKALENTIVPSLFDGRGADNTVRIWVPGCATGEEAYSLAMLLRERMDMLGTPPRVQIFATDIDELALSVARAGRYPAAMVSGVVSPEREKRFFANDGEMRILTKEVRELCVFSAHSVLRDPPFSRMDLISCRNLLIYLDGEVQRRVIPLFHYALRPGGHLFLGTAEGIGQFGELFAPVEKKNRIFRRRDHHVAIDVPLWMPDTPHAPAGRGMTGRTQAMGLPLRQLVDRRLLERFAPGHVVVNREGDVVHYSAGTGKYLEPAAGAPSRHLLAMARRGLRLDLRSALQEAMEHRRSVQRRQVEVELEDRIQLVTITVEPLGDDQADPLFLVLFADQGPPLTPAEAAEQGRRAPEGGGSAQRLEQELRETRDRLQATIEEYETALEELKSANEELVSMNEELQSTNEELQTAKEEQQSVNEELQTVNVELHSKIEELDRVNADLRNLFDSTRAATIFLDTKLVIRNFTPSAAEVFKLLPGDRGRPLTDITSELDYPELQQDLDAVLHTNHLQERQVMRRDGTLHYLARIAPYRADNGRVHGVIATFAEVTRLVHAEEHQRKLVAELNHRVKNTLAVVQSIAIASLEQGSAREVFLSRLRSMSRTHDLLSREGWTSAPLLDILKGEAAPYASDGRERLVLSGPSVLLSPRLALSLALVFHELATNSAKYGALSADGGHVEIGWRVASTPDGQRLRLSWQEIDGPPTKEPSRRGFGSRVIEREIRNGLGGEVQLEFRTEGLRGYIDVPLNGRPGVVPQADEPSKEGKPEASSGAP